MNGLFKVKHKKYGYKYMIYDVADDSGDIYFLMYIGLRCCGCVGL